jgi:hypothetical protein
MADRSFVDNLNEIVQDFFSNTNLSYDKEGIISGYADKSSYVYAKLIKTKGKDIIKLANMRNFLSDWERPGTFGGYTRRISVKPIVPMDPPSFENGTSPDPHVIMKPDLIVSYHPFRVRMEYGLTQTPNQLDDVFNNSAEAGFFLAAILEALTSGMSDSLYRISKEVFFKYWSELNSTLQTQLSSNEIPAASALTTKEAAIQAVNAIRNYVTKFMFGEGNYNSMGFPHTVDPTRIRLYIIPELANKLTDLLVLDHYMGNVTYTNTAQNLSAFLGIQVSLQDDLGGRIPLDSDGNRLYPIYDFQGSVTGTYAAAKGGTTPVPVASWDTVTGYDFRAMLTEDDFGLMFVDKDTINTFQNPRGGGYMNTFRFTDRQLCSSPSSNTMYFH